MLIFIVWCIAAVGIVHGILFDDLMAPQSFFGWFFGCLFSLFFVAFAAMLCGGAAYGIGTLFPVTTYKAGAIPLTVIRDKDGIEGRFFLGTGTLESKPYYFYYAKNGDGSVSPGKISYDTNVRVYQEKREDAQIVRWASKSKYSWVWIFAAPPSDEWYGVDFHVPEGTVKSGYSM